MNSASGRGVDPRSCTRREAKSMTAPLVGDQALPRQTSVVKKSAPAMLAQCVQKRLPRRRALRDRRQARGLQDPALVERPTQCPTFLSAPGSACSPTSDSPSPSAPRGDGSLIKRRAVRISGARPFQAIHWHATAARCPASRSWRSPQGRRPTRTRAAGRQRSSSVRRSRRPPS
jgi:hypothetical protein